MQYRFSKVTHTHGGEVDMILFECLMRCERVQESHEQEDEVLTSCRFAGLQLRSHGKSGQQPDDHVFPTANNYSILIFNIYSTLL
jgi:hypothetical protein